MIYKKPKYTSGCKCSCKHNHIYLFLITEMTMHVRYTCRNISTFKKNNTKNETLLHEVTEHAINFDGLLLCMILCVELYSI